MDAAYLTAQEALRALADGRVLENDDGAEVLLDGSLIVMRYTMGKNQTLVAQNYNGAFEMDFTPNYLCRNRGNQVALDDQYFANDLAAIFDDMWDSAEGKPKDNKWYAKKLAARINDEIRNGDVQPGIPCSPSATTGTGKIK